MKINLLGYDLNALKEYFASIGEVPFRAVQLLKWIHQHKVSDFNLMTNISMALREKLVSNCEIKSPKITNEQISRDGTVKWLMQVGNDNFIETVFIPEEKRGTLCISSQVGCVLNCTFCATATSGFNRNLTSDEIIGQLYSAEIRLSELKSLPNFKTIPKISNVVLMGMGEPLFNYSNVLKAINIMREDNAYGLAKRRVTISTSGIIPGILKLATEADVALALSLHAPTDELRTKIMPVNKKYPIKKLIEACKKFLSYHPKSKITIEYLMLDGVNDSSESAKQLAKLLQGVACKVNLIPFNPFLGSAYIASSLKKVESFKNIISRSGIVCTIRKQRGIDISASCGQLAGKIKDKTKRQERYIASILEDNDKKNKD